uniref:Angiotensinogen n=1 Tax=Astatotilapia calliptera TaxID=8154 RepID=A0AAX7SJ05_ASTCA
MQRLWSPLLVLLLYCCLSGSQANRVYVHPFYLFAAENVSCESLQAPTVKPLETLPVAPLDNEVLTPDHRDPSKVDVQRQNITERTAVLAALLNALGLRMYQALSSKQHSTNTLLSPVNTFGSLVTFYLGASKKTAGSFQLLLGLSRDTDGKDCVSLMDGHKVLKTLQGINSLVDDGPRDEITTQEAEQLVNSFVEMTSDRKVKDIFKDLNATSNLLFITSFNFQGNWKKAFQPEETTLKEFHVDQTTTVMAPLMTHTGQYHYFNDKARQCTIVKLSLSKRSYMLLVLPHEGVKLGDVESKLRTDIISDWHQNLQEGLLELSLPKFSMSSVTDLRDLLTTVNPEIEAKLFGSEADFGQLSNTKPFTIDKAINKVLFEMSEEGAEPQDQTQEEGVPLKLSINRPFFFSVVEGNSNSILMLGKIINPLV